MGAIRHEVSYWNQAQVGRDSDFTDPTPPYVMRVFGWLCSTCRTWGAEPDARAREQAIAQHVAHLPPDRSIVAMLERLWEKLAEETADCAGPDPSICGRHAFEEAARLPDGALFMCGVHGSRLAVRIAEAIQEERARMESQYRRLAGEVQKATADAIMRDLSQVRIPHPSRHVQGCGAGKDNTKACICPPGHPGLAVEPPGCVPGCDFVVTGYHAKRSGRVLCSPQADDPSGDPR